MTDLAAVLSIHSPGHRRAVAWKARVWAWGHALLPRRLRPLERAGLLSRVRRLFWFLSLLGIALKVPELVSGGQWAGVAGLGVLLVWWTWGFRRGRFPAWGLLIEGLALGAIELTSTDPVRLALLFYAGLCLHALYTKRLGLAGLVATYVGARLSGQLIFGSDLDVVLLALDAIGFAACAVVISGVGEGVAERDDLVRHQGVLARAASRLVSAAAAEEIHAIALAALGELVADRGEPRAAVFAGDGAALSLVAAHGLGPTRIGETKTAEEWGAPFVEAARGRAWAGGGRLLQGVASLRGGVSPGSPVTLVQPIVLHDAIRGVLAVERAASWTPAVRDVVAHLGSVIALALDRLDHVETLRHRAHHDPLTELANRSLFQERLERAGERARAAGDSLAVLMIDVDNFKSVNDTMGHETGDQVLRSFAGRLVGCMRRHELVARIGGDEFVVLLEGADEDEAVAIASRLLGALDLPFEVGGRLVPVEASIGIAVGGADAADAPRLLGRADVAMYVAKNSGKHRFRIAGEPPPQPATRDLAGDLRHAIAHDELSIHFQPLVDLVGGRLVGYEALARWHHPRHGLVPPDRFVALAEEIGAIVELDRQILRGACRQMSDLVRDRSRAILPYLSVNLSASGLLRTDFVEAVTGALADARFPAERLTLEITESVVVSWSDEVVARLQRLRDLGVRIALDDFGTGYAAIGALLRAPIDVLKIDRSFVSGLARGGRDAALVHSMVQMAEILGVETVAEGIETAEQRDHLVELGCRVGQGFWFAPPLPVDRLGEFVGEVGERGRGSRRDSDVLNFEDGARDRRRGGRRHRLELAAGDLEAVAN